MTADPVTTGGTRWGTPQIYTFDQMPAEISSHTYRRTAIRGDDCMVTLNFFEPGNPPWPLHNHPFDQLLFVLSGRMEVRLGDDTVEVAAPSVVWVPRDLPHCANIVGDQPCLNLDVFGVAREDFLHLTSYQGAWADPPVDAAAP